MSIKQRVTLFLIWPLIIAFICAVMIFMWPTIWMMGEGK